jgi:hypothetical protein
LAACELQLTTSPAARPAGENLAQRLGRKHLHLPIAYHPEEIRRNIRLLADAMGCPVPVLEADESLAEQELAQALDVVKNTPVSIDYTATPRPASLAKLLLEHGFHVERLYLDVMIPDEEPAFRWLQSHCPELQILPTVHPAMRFAPQGKKSVAIGQKAAYFDGTPHFVNMIEGGGLYGFRGIGELARQLVCAAAEEKNIEQTVRRKGLGCESCLL